jgi:hypothetical protein
VKRIEIDPADVRVVGAAPDPKRRDSRFGLRLKIAGLLAFAEVILVAVGHFPALLMTAIAVGLVAFHIFVGRKLPTFLRHVSWTLALAQALVALFIAAIGVSIFVVTIVLLLVLIVGVMMLLGERR